MIVHAPKVWSLCQLHLKAHSLHPPKDLALWGSPNTHKPCFVNSFGIRTIRGFIISNVLHIKKTLQGLKVG